MPLPTFFVLLTAMALLPTFMTESVTLNGTTSQSSIYKQQNEPQIWQPSSFALDGNRTLCAHTNSTPNPWWRVDLHGVYNISSITIFNIVNSVSDAILDRTKIYIGDSERNISANQLCVIISNFTTGDDNTYECEGGVLSGRYVSIHSEETKKLILCEVTINGSKIASPMKLVKMNKTWEYAVDHCRGNDSDIISIGNQRLQTWAELEAAEAETSLVWLGLRFSCVVEFWFWIDDTPLEFKRWAPGNGTDDEKCDMSGAIERDGNHSWLSRPDEEELNFICSGEP